MTSSFFGCALTTINSSICPGGMAQRTSHQPQRQQPRVRIPPGYKVFRENIPMLLCVFVLKCIVCVLKKRINASAH
jgi:hypothetical protein